MNKIYRVLIALSLVFLLMSCHDSKKETPQGFVYLEDAVFKIDGETFFPLMLNYRIDFRKIDGEIIVSPCRYYENNAIYESNTKEEILDQLAGHVELAKELGFNSLRICMDLVLSDDKGYFYKTDKGGAYINDSYEEIFDAIDGMLNVIERYDMKVMLLLKPAMDKELKDFTKKLFRRFADNTTIFAWDMMNEPLYFDTDPKRKKDDAVDIVSEWRDMVRQNAPNHLFTIGFSEPIEVFEWDPSILPVDFVQFHTYNPLRIPNEIWWYSHYVGKPWMIGETSLPADNEEISYGLQALFVEQAYQYTIDCGGIGFGWWEFQDCLVRNMNFEARYAGLLNNQGVTTTKGGHEIIGTLKPAAYEFDKLHELKPEEPVRLCNYFNMLGYENFMIKGRVVCNKKPVEGAVIRGWNDNWHIGMNTFSDENGDFTLYSNDTCVHFEVSAPGLSKVKFDKRGLKYVGIDGSECDFSDLKNVDLEYQKMSYFPFFANDTMLFEFKPELFDRARYVTDMGKVSL